MEKERKYYSASQKKASRKYNEENYARIGMYLQKDQKECWQQQAKEIGYKDLSTMIKDAVEFYINSVGVKSLTPKSEV